MKVAHGMGEVHTCEHCGQRFATSSRLEKHVDVVHLKKKNFQCERCDKLFYHSGHLEQHVQKCTL